MGRIEKFSELSREHKNEILASGYLSEDLHKYLEARNRMPSDRAQYVFSASELGSDSGLSACGNYRVGCERMLAYRYIGAPTSSTWTSQERLRLDGGTAIHRMMQDHFTRAAGLDIIPLSSFKDEVLIADHKMEISTTADAYYVRSSNDYVMEIKTIATTGFNSLNSPKRDHLTQGMVYMACLDVPVINFMYISFDSQLLIKEFMVEFDQDHWQAVVDKMDAVRDKIFHDKELAKEGARVNKFFCRRCKYAHICLPSPASIEKRL